MFGLSASSLPTLSDFSLAAIASSGVPVSSTRFGSTPCDNNFLTADMSSNFTALIMESAGVAKVGCAMAAAVSTRLVTRVRHVLRVRADGLVEDVERLEEETVENVSMCSLGIT